jgi:hypothetical protein
MQYNTQSHMPFVMTTCAMRDVTQSQHCGLTESRSPGQQG